MKNPSGHFSLGARPLDAQSLRALPRRIWRQLQRWWQLAEQRRLLATLDDRALQDIGISRAEAQRESERPFWDDPLPRRVD